VYCTDVADRRFPARAPEGFRHRREPAGGIIDLRFNSEARIEFGALLPADPVPKGTTIFRWQYASAAAMPPAVAYPSAPAALGWWR
jgi:hypothetical protein